MPNTPPNGKEDGKAQQGTVSKKSRLKELPVEVRGKITDYLTRKEVAALRRVSKL